MLFARWIVRCAVIATAALVLTGCPSITQQGQLPPSVDRAESLARSIADPQRLVPMLQEIKLDESVPLIARNHAERLLQTIKKGK